MDAMDDYTGAVRSAVIRIRLRTRQALLRHTAKLTDEERNALIDKCHRDLLAEIADPKIRFRVAKVLSYEGAA
jgi:hypothetical protein